MLLGFFLGGVGGDSNKVVVLRVIAETMKICLISMLEIIHMQRMCPKS